MYVQSTVFWCAVRWVAPATVNQMWQHVCGTHAGCLHCLQETPAAVLLLLFWLGKHAAHPARLLVKPADIVQQGELTSLFRRQQERVAAR